MKLNNKGFSAIEGVIVVLVIAALGGAGYYVYSKNSENKSITTQSATETVSEIPEELSGVLPLEQVEELAKKENPDVTIKGIELKVEDGVLVYVIQLSNGKELTINAANGTQISISDGTENEDGDSLPQGMTAKISIASAVAIAKKEYPGVGLEKVEIETEDGILIYRVQFTDETRVEVDANNGSVMEVDSKDDKKDKKREEERNDDDHDDDGKKNSEDEDDDDDGTEDRRDNDDDEDEVEDDEDEDDDNDDVDDDDDDDSGEDEN